MQLFESTAVASYDLRPTSQGRSARRGEGYERLRSNHPYFSDTAALRTRNLRATSHTSGAGLELLGATVRAGSHSAQAMTSQMFAPRVTRLGSLVRLISQTLPTEHTSRKERALRRYFGIWRENSDRGSLVPEHRQRCRRSDCNGDQRPRQRFPMYLSQGTMSRIASPPPTRLLRRFIFRREHPQ